MTKFYRMNFPILGCEVAVNENSIRAVVPTDEADSYRVWLTGEMNVTDDIAQRIVKLAGIRSVSKDWWDVKSTDLKVLFPSGT